MANELVLMEKGFDRMNVPLSKVAAYLAEGWKEVSREAMDSQPASEPKAAAPAAATKGKPKGKPTN